MLSSFNPAVARPFADNPVRHGLRLVCRVCQCFDDVGRQCFDNLGRHGIGRCRQAFEPALPRSLFVAFAFCAAILWQGSPAMAQTDAGEPPVEAAAPSGEATIPPDAPTLEDEPQTRTFFQTLLDGGIVALLIILLSIAAVGFSIEHILSIRKDVLLPERVLGPLEDMIAHGRAPEAIDFCQRPENQCLAADVVLAGLIRYQSSPFGFAEYKAAMEEEGEDQTAQLYRKTEVLGLIGQIAPMLGLTGTVWGMITAFNTMAAKGGNASPDELAGGIGQALITTLLGLLVAIPAMVAFTYFRNMIDSLVAEGGKRIERITMPLSRKK